MLEAILRSGRSGLFKGCQERSRKHGNGSFSNLAFVGRTAVH